MVINYRSPTMVQYTDHGRLVAEFTSTMKKTLLLDNGHGSNTAGKRSPDGTLLEWQYTRDIADKIAELTPLGLNIVLITPETNDITLTERVRRVNDYIAKHPNERCVLISVHGNAGGNGGWQSGRGWEVFTTRGQNNSDRLAECIAKRVQKNFATKLRADNSDGDLDKEANFKIIREANCPCCLTENFFYDNQDDLKLMQNESVQYAIAQMHIEGVMDYFKSIGL